MTAAELKAKLTERVQGLQRQRAEMEARHLAQVTVLEQQLSALRDLAVRFDSLNLSEALSVLQQTGVSVEIK